MNYNDALQKRKERIFPGLKTYYEQPVLIRSGSGQYLYDDQGRRFLDCYSGVATANLGYGNEALLAPVIEQLKKVQHVSSLYLSEPMLNLAERLVELLDETDYKVMFCNSGSEGIEFLTLLSRLYKKQGYILAFQDSYHGMSLFANYLTGLKHWKHHGDIELRAASVETPYCYRCQYRSTDGKCGLECTASLEKTIEKLGGENLAAFLFEPVLGVGGIIIPPREYFQIAAQMVKKYQGLLLADEVQTGMGRTGSWFGFQNYGILPDAFCLGKGMGNGLPIGAIVAKSSLADLTTGVLMYCTFGGNPVSCAHSLAAIELMVQENIVAEVKGTGQWLLQKWEELYQFPWIGDVRGLGLLMGIEIVEDQASKKPAPSLAQQIVNQLKEELILAGLGGIYGNVVRIAPPFLVTRDDLEYLTQSLIRVLKNFKG